MSRLSRRDLLQLTAAGLAASTKAAAAPAPVPSLGGIAAKNGYLFGSAAAEVIDNDPAYRELYVTQTKIVTTDVALKMGRIAAQPGPKHFETADRLLAFCDRNLIAMRGHCLIWNEWVPDWIKTMSASERRSFFNSYIDDVVARYADACSPGTWSTSRFGLGTARPAASGWAPGMTLSEPTISVVPSSAPLRSIPRTRLVLNEAQTERDDEVGLAVRSGLLKLVADLKHAGVKLDVVGLQGHLQPQYPHDPGRFDGIPPSTGGSRRRHLHH